MNIISTSMQTVACSTNLNVATEVVVNSISFTHPVDPRHCDIGSLHYCTHWALTQTKGHVHVVIDINVPAHKLL